MTKRHLFLTALLFFCIGVVQGFAYDFSSRNDQGKTIYYTITSTTEKTVEVAEKADDYSNKYFEGCFSIPDTVLGPDGTTYKVTGIGKKAFYYFYLTGVKLPSGLTYIGDYAFSDCKSLTNIELPSGLTNIGDYAFSGCWDLTNFEFPSGLTDIGDYAFSSCRSLTNIELPSGLKKLGSYSFDDCDGLASMTSLDLPNGLEEFYGSAISSLTSLASITIPASVLTSDLSGLPSNIKKIIFLGNTRPLGVYPSVEDNRICYVSSRATYGFGTEYKNLSSMFEVDGVKYVIYDTKTRTCDVIDCNYDSTPESIVVDSLVSYRNIKLKVRNINDYAFYNCDLVHSAVINNNGFIGHSAFYDCDNLGNATLGNNICDIYDSAFTSCDNLKEIIVPDNVSSVGSYCFKDCTSLNKAVIGNGVGKLALSTFYNCSSMSEVTVGENVAIIEESVFEKCKSLLSIRIPQATKQICNKVFTGCNSLAIVSIADRTDTITLGYNIGRHEDNALFIDCQLDSVYVGGKLYYDPKKPSPFGGTTLKSITFNDQETTIYDYEFYNCQYLKNVVLGKGITSIGKAAFAHCISLPSFDVHDEVQYLGRRSFYGCSSLKTAKIGTNIKTLEWATFEDCSSLTNVNVGVNVESIAKSVFRGCTSLPSISIPQATQIVSDSVFYNCTSLADVIIEDRTTTLSLGTNGSSSSSNASSSKHPLFHSCPLDSVYIGGKIKYNTTSQYGFSPFFRNTSLRTVVVADTETEVYENEFYGCSGLTDVVLGDGITSIGAWAFSGCISLKNFAFGSSVQTIGKEAFSDCTSMVKLVSSCNVPPVCGEQALADINVWDCTLYVPNDYIDDYYMAEQWWDFFFVEGAEYKVTFMIGEELHSECMVKYGAQIELPTPVREGYTFQGWKDVPATMPADNIIVYGSFNPNDYTITYIVDGEIFETETLPCDAMITPIVAPTKDDYTFSYWENLPATMPAGDITVIAVYVDKVKEVQVVVNQYGSGTYCSEYALDFSNIEGLKAYAATGFNSNTQVVTMTRVNTSDAGVGLFIKGEPGTYTVPVIDASNDNSLNMLVGALENITIDGTSNDGAYTNFKYTVTSGSATPMFYQFTDGSSFTRGKAYLQIPTEWLTVMPSKTIKIKFDDGYTTGLEDILEDSESTSIYDLNGRKVMNPTRGLYIVNGKKVIIK